MKPTLDVRATWFVMAVLVVGGCKAASAPAATPATVADAPATVADAPATVDAPTGAPVTVDAPATVAAPAENAEGTWIGGDVAAWRSAQLVRDVVVLDERRALALVGSSSVAVFDLGTGAVTEHALDLSGGVRITRLVSAGKRLIAYGFEGKVSGAWSVDPTTLVATALPLADAVAAKSTAGWSAMAVSPDGTQVVTCSDDRWPTLRDAATMKAVTVFTDVTSCKEPRFSDATHVRITLVGSKDVRLLDLKAGTAALVPETTALVLPGPGGRSAELAKGQMTVRAADGKEIATHAARFTNPMWLGDGSAIVATLDSQLTVIASGSAQPPHKLELPARVQRLTAIPGTTRLVVQFGGHRLGVLDAATGTVVTARGVHLGAVAKIAALDGAVVSGGEHLQVWRDGQVTASGPRAVIEAIDVDAGAPVMVATFDGVFRAQLDTGVTEAFDSDASSVAIDRQGARVVWDRDDRVMMQFGDDAPTNWMRRKSDFFVCDLDVGTGRIAFNDDNAFYVVRPDRREVFGFNTFDCGSPTYIWLDRGRERAATYDGVTVHLYDTAKKKGVGGLELVDDNIEAMTFIPGSTSVAVVGESIYLWDPGKRTVAAWPLPSERARFAATSIGVDPAGTQLAVGFADGAVMWLALDTLRAQVTPVGPDVATVHSAAALRCDKPVVTRYDDLVEPEPEDDDDPD